MQWSVELSIGCHLLYPVLGFSHICIYSIFPGVTASDIMTPARNSYQLPKKEGQISLNKFEYKNRN